MRVKDKHKHIRRIKWLVRSKFDEKKYKSMYKRNNKCPEQETRKSDDTGKEDT